MITETIPVAMIRRIFLGLLALFPLPAKAQQAAIPCDRDDCRLITLSGSTTLMAFYPEFDKHGRPIGNVRDPNTYTFLQECRSCGRRFQRTDTPREGLSAWVDVTPAKPEPPQ